MKSNYRRISQEISALLNDEYDDHSGVGRGKTDDSAPPSLKSESVQSAQLFDALFRSVRRSKAKDKFGLTPARSKVASLRCEFLDENDGIHNPPFALRIM